MISMKRILPMLLTLFCFHVVHAQNNPSANQAAMVIHGNARFTILTERLIRMEWAKDGVFEDKATLVVVNRDLPVPRYSKKESNGKLVLKTKEMTLTYSPGQEEGFTTDNLKVSFKMNGEEVVWHPGDSTSGNLRGTIRTLDKIKGRESKTALSFKNKFTGRFEPVELENGILSKDGWAIIDDSKSHLFEKDDSDWGEWVRERPAGNRQDLYIFAYGHDYKEALKDYTRIAGKIPLPPKFAFGYWWSRYWAYTDDELREIASEMRTRGIPMDVVVVDMDWHLTWKELDEKYGRDEFGQRHGWTGYTWNKELFPDPKAFLNDIHAMNYKVALNLHPASGIHTYEEPYSRFVSDYLSRTKEYDGPDGYMNGGKPATVPFRLDQQAWADSYFETVIRPLEKQGVDFWWLDWQQWKESKYIPGLSNTYWCNWTFWGDKLRQGKRLGETAPRPIIYHRWGGLGSHRYQIGFSGDTYDEWSVLEMLPYFTATASNVGYGYWGHDIGGHMQLLPHDTDPEMYTRWLQFGVFTPIFKTHASCGLPGSGQSGTIDPTIAAASNSVTIGLERKIWAYPSHYEYMKKAIELRYALSPYIYSAARQAYDTGVCICRPLYYEYPEMEEAYANDHEYFFGDNILATALCEAAVDGKTKTKIWFPSGCGWYDMAAREMRQGGSTMTLSYTIDQNPWFVREGSIIPMAKEGIQNLQTASNELVLLVVPGSNDSRIRIYEDDGISQAYDKNYATTDISKTCGRNRVRIVIDSRKGFYDGAPSSRKLTLKFEAAGKQPRKITHNGKAVTEFELIDGQLFVYLPESPVDVCQTVRVKF